MEIAHQLPGRVRIRIPGLASKDFCEKLIKKLSKDDRISKQRISAACNSLIVSYDPSRIQTEDLISLLSDKKPSKPSKARNAVKAKAFKPRKSEKVPSAKRDRKKSLAKAGKTAASQYFKPAVSSDVQEKIRLLISREDPHKPLSDDRISALLKEEEIAIARRTVAKYREMMNIPASSKRRKQNAP